MDSAISLGDTTEDSAGDCDSVSWRNLAAPPQICEAVLGRFGGEPGGDAK